MSALALAPVLQHSLQGIVRIEVEHLRSRRFRLLFLVELALAIGLSFIVVPLVLLLVIFGDGDGDVPLPSFESMRQRAWVRWREMRVRLVGVQGQQIAVASTKIDTLEEGDKILGHVLSVANNGRIAVVEWLDIGAVSAVWYGGQPLMLGPEAVDEARAWRILQHQGAVMEDDGQGRCIITLSKAPPKRTGAVINLIFMTPLWIWTADGRERLGELRAAARGHGTDVRFEVDAHGVSYRRSRGTEQLDGARIDRTDLLGIAHATVLTPAPNVAFRGPFLRLQTAESAVVLDVERNADVGRALRDALVGATHRLWSGLSQSGAPAHCPHCATLYPYAPGTCCPSCGAPPTALHGLASPRG